MNEVLENIGSDEILALAGMLVGVIAILGGCAVAITMVVSSNRRRAQLDEMEATLKMEMIQQGMSADDIRKVLDGRASRCRDRTLHDLLKPPPAPTFAKPANLKR